MSKRRPRPRWLACLRPAADDAAPAAAPSDSSQAPPSPQQRAAAKLGLPWPSPAGSAGPHAARKAAAAASLHLGSGGGSNGSSGAGDAGSSVIPALYEPPAPGAAAELLSSECAPSTSYPTSYEDKWDALGACMTTAREMEACVDAVLEGSIKSAQTLFSRYDMDLDGQLKQQDYYDLCLELALALPYPAYAAFVEATFACADADGDGLLSLVEFIPLYKAIAHVRRAFRHQDHHGNGQIDRYDFCQLLVELQLELEGGTHDLRAYADAAFGLADSSGRGIVNFGQTLLWWGNVMLATKRQLSSSGRPSSSQLLLEQQRQQQQQLLQQQPNR